MIRVFTCYQSCDKWSGCYTVAEQICRTFSLYDCAIVVLRCIDVNMMLIDKQGLRYNGEPFVNLVR